MAEHQAPQQGSRFVVDLGSVKLPPILEKQVETDIRAVVLEALAKSDAIGRARLGPSIFDWFPGRTLGLWLDPDWQIPWPDGELGPRDHTMIVRAIMDHPFHILRALHVSRGDAKPSGTEVLEAALEVDAIDSYVKERIKAVLEILPQIEKAQARGGKRTLARIENLIAGRPLAEQVRLLRDPKSIEGLNEERAADVLHQVAMILEDGAGTIYSPDLAFYQSAGSASSTAKKDTVDTIKDADALGATGGGLAGTLIPGVGTAAGAAAGGAGASAGAAIGALIDWLF